MKKEKYRDKNKVEIIIKVNKVFYKRYLDIPVDLAFEVWSSQEHISQLGLEGFSLTIQSIDFFNDGIWDFIIHGPDGRDYINIDIKKPYYKQIGDGDKDVDFQSKIIFEEVGEDTNLTMEQIFSNKKELKRVNEKYGAIEGGKQHVYKFGKYLEALKWV
nr:SRPBCC domain-containing protein [Leptospira noguchii]